MIQRISIGDVFERLTVQGRAEDAVTPCGTTRVMWTCQCACGQLRVVNAQHLRNGKIRSCGCLRKELATERAHTHGESHTLLYGVWVQMLQRCENPKNTSYRRYGGRGIAVCQRWHDFKLFKDDMGPTYQIGLQIEREKNEKGYEPGNCVWTTNKRNCRNQRKTVRVRWEGKEVALIDLADRYGIKPTTLYARIKVYGWTLRRALTQNVAPTEKRHM